MEGLTQLGSFNTIEGFYRHYAHLLRPSELPRDHNCYLFRKPYKPMWEEFPEGGCWIIRIKRKASQNYVNHMQSLHDYSTYRNAKNYMFAPSPNVTPLQGTLDTPVHSHQGNPDQDFDAGMLPPA